ncbi:CopG family transcriptional regulator [Phenylobacterium sp.]|uniref:CopG family transcriptional regulator n=1 Tax=Phenylobacterium sp. TaxID=1871053 RepID=UPI0025CC9077|nr:CopG family transcriptional regulator [Phenylobacterium sp.]
MKQRRAEIESARREQPDTLEASIARGLADAEAGRVVPHSEVKLWLEKLARGERAPRPRSR